ncbi:MAG: hypothetical protein ACLGHW_03935, partial [Gammaproteobacteria bacterium]
MKTYLPVLCAALALMAAGAVHASTSTQSQGVAPAAQKQQPADAAPEPATLVAAGDDKNKMVCKRIKATGTRMGARVCRTEEEWELVEYGARETMRAIEGTSMPRDA